MTNPNQIPVPILGEEKKAPPQITPDELLVFAPNRVRMLKVPRSQLQGMGQIIEHIENLDQRQIWLDIFIALISRTERALSPEQAREQADLYFEQYIVKCRPDFVKAEEETDVSGI